MPRARWFLVGLILLAGFVLAFLDARGPFSAYPPLDYDQFLADFRTGQVGQIVQWRNQLEVIDGGMLRIATVPVDRDLAADLGQARDAGGVGIAFKHLPDAWLTVITPLGPALVAIAGFVIWVTAIRGERRRSSARPRAIG